MPALDEAVRLRPLDACGSVLDAFELEEQLVRVPAGSTEDLAKAVARTERNLDAALARVAELEAFMQLREAFRAEMRRELESLFAEEAPPGFPA